MTQAPRIWSDYQEAIFSSIARGRRGPHLEVRALAGTGKSTTIEEAIQLTPDDDRVLALAFNKSIADALRERLPSDVDARTFHSLGSSAIDRSRGGARPKLENYYVHDLARGNLRSLPFADQKEAVSACAKLVSRAKNCLLAGAHDLDALVDTMQLQLVRSVRLLVVKTAAAIMQASAKRITGSINYDDMIWLPVVQSLALPSYGWVFVDEFQDLNPCQIEMVLMLAEAGEGGQRARVIYVGDKHQAIYGFRGADSDAMARMRRELQAESLPLSICYRCPASVIAEAKRIVPAIEAAPTAAPGSVHDCDMARLLDEVTPGDFVISRTNAPLIAICHRLLAAGVRARIRGRDIAEGLVAWIEKAKATSIADLVEKLTTWEAGEIERLDKLGRDTSATSDKADCLRALAACRPTVDGLLDYITELFATSDDNGNRHDFVELSTVHRAKGLETDVVWLLRDTFMRARWVPLEREEPEEGEKVWVRNGVPMVKRLGGEEANLLYVAITRAKSELFYASGSLPAAEFGSAAAE